MTRKDYEKFAAMLKDVRSMYTYKPNDTFNPTLEVICEQTANIFAEDNPRFDRERFLEAAGFK
jgi:hypothetical protein